MTHTHHCLRCDKDYPCPALVVRQDSVECAQCPDGLCGPCFKSICAGETQKQKVQPIPTSHER